MAIRGQVSHGYAKLPPVLIDRLSVCRFSCIDFYVEVDVTPGIWQKIFRCTWILLLEGEIFKFHFRLSKGAYINIFFFRPLSRLASHSPLAPSCSSVYLLYILWGSMRAFAGWIEVWIILLPLDSFPLELPLSYFGSWCFWAEKGLCWDLDEIRSKCW